MATNDVLGFQEPASGAGGTVAAGTPGALAGTQPISIDAIDEMQVVLSPFNVTLSNFTGANINAVTKSGTNRLAGTVYSFARNQIITGRSVDADRKPIESYYDIQSGASSKSPSISSTSATCSTATGACSTSCPTSITRATPYSISYASMPPKTNRCTSSATPPAPRGRRTPSTRAGRAS